ncbi:MAG: hypothetical protein ACI865_002278 [Flavobacteriaceae bacterium]|jgi:hypothetical protein
MKNVLLLSVFVSLTSLAQDTLCTCCTEKYQQSQFWLGEWVVFDTDEAKVGRNDIVSMQDDCTLQENWVSASSTRQAIIITTVHRIAGIKFGLTTRVDRY